MPPPITPPAVAWAPAKLSTTLTPTKETMVPRELLELAKQLELVEHQRQQLLLSTSSPPASPLRRRPPSPAAAILAPLPLSPPRSKSLGLAPALAASDVVVCDLCAAELPSAPFLKTHKTTSCPQLIVTCPRGGCGRSFAIADRAAHDRDECVHMRRTQQLLEEHVRAHTLVACAQCGEPTEVRAIDNHQRFLCVKRQVSCQYEAFGCHDKFPFDQREVHETASCRVARHRAKVRADAVFVNEEMVCDWCGQSVLKRKLLDHQEDECPKRERPCPNAINGCPGWVPVDAVDDHLKTSCVVTRERNAMAAHAHEMNVLVVCTECGLSIKKRYLSAHATRECVSRIVNCKNAAHGCRARLRWRDRHLHEDFMALASHERSMLQFPVGGRAYVALQSELTDLPPPWTLELFLWIVSAKEEILDVHAKALDLVETVVVKQREHTRFEEQSKTCKKKLKELKKVKRKPDPEARSTSQILGDATLVAQALADEFNAADSGVVTTAQAIALAKGEIRILITDAHRLLMEERQRDTTVATEIQQQIESQALDRVTSREFLGSEFLSEDEQLRLGDLDRWIADVAPSGNRVLTAEAKARVAEQRKLLDKRATLQQSMDNLVYREQQGEVEEAEAARLRRRYDREVAKVEAKLALVADHTPTVLLERRGRHVVASSARSAILLAGAGTGRITFVRSVPGANAKLAPRGPVDFPVSLSRNRWHHVAFCAGPHELTLIVNGEVQAVKHGVFELPFARFGSNDPVAADSFQGFFQEVRVWKSCLSKEYLVAHATQIIDVPRNAGDLFAYYTLEEGGGDVIDDMALRQPRAACLNTTWILYNTATIRQKFGLPPTPSLRDKTSCMINQRLKFLAQRARDRETEPLACRLHCGVQLPLKLLELHQRTQCDHRLVVCDEIGCEKVFRAIDRVRHWSECERRTYREALVKQYHDRETLEPCLLQCGERIKRRHAERHYLRECRHRLVACPQPDCGESIVAKGLSQHLSVDCKSAELVADRIMVVNARQRQQDQLTALQGGTIMGRAPQ